MPRSIEAQARSAIQTLSSGSETRSEKRRSNTGTAVLTNPGLNEAVQKELRKSGSDAQRALVALRLALHKHA
jgi:hypothetical protein